MATIEDTLRMREEFIKSIEESKSAIADILEKYDSTIYGNLNTSSQFYEPFLLSAKWQQHFYETIARTNNWQQKLYETIAHSNDWQQQLYKTIAHSNDWQRKFFETIAHTNDWQQQLYETIARANDWRQQFNEALATNNYYEHVINCANITEPDFEKILQQVKAVSEAIQYDTAVRKNTTKKKKFKRKVSIRNAHAIRQRYKNKQINSLCKNVLSYSLNKLDVKTTPFFIGIIEYVKDLPIPENLKIYFSIMLIPLWIRMYYLITHSDALAEKTNNPQEEVK